MNCITFTCDSIRDDWRERYTAILAELSLRCEQGHNGVWFTTSHIWMPKTADYAYLQVFACCRITIKAHGTPATVCWHFSPHAYRVRCFFFVGLAAVASVLCFILLPWYAGVIISGYAWCQMLGLLLLEHFMMISFFSKLTREAVARGTVKRQPRGQNRVKGGLGSGVHLPHRG